MHLAGAQVVAEDTKEGAAMVFTTSGDVAELRRRVHHLAEMHQMRMANRDLKGGPGNMGNMGPGTPGSPGATMGSGAMGSGAMGPGTMGPKPMMGAGHMPMAMVPSTARAEDTDGGARLVLTPEDPTKLAELRAQVREHAAHMANGECPMRHGHA